MGRLRSRIVVVWSCRMTGNETGSCRKHEHLADFVLRIERKRSSDAEKSIENSYASLLVKAVPWELYSRGNCIGTELADMR